MADLLTQYAKSRECLKCGSEWVQAEAECPGCGGYTIEHNKHGEKLRVWGEMLQTHLEGVLGIDERAVERPEFQQLYEAAHYLQTEGMRQAKKEDCVVLKLVVNNAK